MEDQIESLLDKIGTGKWNIFPVLVVGYVVVLMAPHALAAPFLVPRLMSNCRTTEGEVGLIHHENNTEPDSCRYSIKLQDGSIEERSCTDWEFDNSTFTSTVTSEFLLTCERDYYRATYQSLYMIGMLVSSPITGVLADRYGRKSVFVCGVSLYAILANISCWLPDLYALFILRFLLGLMHPINVKCGYILAMETSAPKARTNVGILVFLPWAFATAAWGGLAYLIRSWRYLLMTASLPGLLILPLLRYLDESPRWLLVRGKEEQALKILKRASKWNKATLPPDEEMTSLVIATSDPVPKAQGEKKNWRTVVWEHFLNAAILFRTARLRLVTLVTLLNNFVLGMVYFGLSLGGGNFAFNSYTFMALMGIVEMPAYTLLAPIVSHFGRKKPTAFCYIMCGVVLLILPFIPESHVWATIVLVMLGKMLIASAFQGNNLLAVELFPTEVRTRGVCFSFMFSRIGSAISPFINDYLGLIYPWAPSVVFGGFSTLAGFALLFLWETMGRPLPETIAQLESADLRKT